MPEHQSPVPVFSHSSSSQKFSLGADSGEDRMGTDGNVRDATPEENAIPALKSDRPHLRLVPLCGADTFHDGSIDTSSS